uniref:hypothetical protein n=1 Tax=Streptosporangium sp. CA-235898 TaxID=3240073 RepID=UPI003F49387C
MLDAFVAMPAGARMKLLDENPDTYWRAMGMYMERLSDQLAECEKNLRADRRLRLLGAGLSRLGEVFTRAR